MALQLQVRFTGSSNPEVHHGCAGGPRWEELRGRARHPRWRSARGAHGGAAPPLRSRRRPPSPVCLRRSPGAPTHPLVASVSPMVAVAAELHDGLGESIETRQPVGLKPLNWSTLRAGRVGSKNPQNPDHEQGDLRAWQRKHRSLFISVVAGKGCAAVIGIVTSHLIHKAGFDRRSFFSFFWE